MGGLIMTRGTKRLVAHYNDEFDTWIQFHRALINYYDVNTYGGAEIKIWSDVIQNPNLFDAAAPGNGHAATATDPTLLPPTHPKHANLHSRWQYFLESVLSKTNNAKLAKGVHDAL